MLDTNTISNLVAGRLPVGVTRLSAIPPDTIFVSSISYGEVWFGMTRRPSKTTVRQSMERFLLEVVILPWTMRTAAIYSTIRSDMEKIGKSLGSLDMLIAAHALEVGATLVTSDRAFRHVPGLTVEDWTAV